RFTCFRGLDKYQILTAKYKCYRPQVNQVITALLEINYVVIILGIFWKKIGVKGFWAKLGKFGKLRT
ncbi:hypothetical protein, partial [Escherichia coli]|uniref:hypothetical protein n=1 Tax=Escherichia coli TaxID=562 RepID=UPI003F470F6C